MKKRALVINDSRFEGIILMDLLVKLGYDVKFADEFNALDIINKYSPDIVIANYIMKNTTGDKFIYEVKTIKPQVLCYLSSCNTLRGKALIKAYDGVIHTPVALKELAALLAEGEKDKKCNSCNVVIDKAFNHCPYCGAKINLTS